MLKIETDFAKVLQIFLKRRVVCRELLAFEVIYFLRQLPKTPPTVLHALRDQVRNIGHPYAIQVQQASAASSGGTSRHGIIDTGALVEHTSAQVFECVVLFYLGDPEGAMEFVPELSRLCVQLPTWCAYIAAHGLYWCGRIFALVDARVDAIRCLRQA